MLSAETLILTNKGEAMKTDKRIGTISVFFVLSILFFYGGCAAEKARMAETEMEGKRTPLKGMELKKIFKKKAVATGVLSKYNRPFVVTYLPDGSQNVVAVQESYPGTYFIEGARYCSRIDHRQGVVRCTTWYRVGENSYEF